MICASRGWSTTVHAHDAGSGMRRALFVCYGGGHSAMLIPLIHALRVRPGWQTAVLALTTAGPQMTRAGIRHFGYRELMHDDDVLARDWGRRLLADSHNPHSGVSVEESAAYLGLSFVDLIERLGEDEALRRYRDLGRHAFMPIGPLRRALDRARPDIVITTNAPKSERAALLVAQERSLPTIYIDDLLAMNAVNPRPFVPPPSASRYCVASRVAADNLVAAYGIERGAIRFTGNPAFDRLARLGSEERSAARTALGFGSSHRVVAYMGSGPIDPPVVTHMAALVREVAGGALVVRRHPGSRTTAVEEFARAVGPDAMVVDDIDLDVVLSASDVVMTVASTTAVEALLLGRGLIQLGDGTGIPRMTGDRPTNLPLYEYGASELLDDLHALPAAIESALTRDQRELESARSVFVRPGDAVNSIVREADQLTGA